jgi:MoxR-like ATPase
MKTSYLHSLGGYGYGNVELIVLAALMTGDPLLLVGRAGTGKAFLLNWRAPQEIAAF